MKDLYDELWAQKRELNKMHTMLYLNCVLFSGSYTYSIIFSKVYDILRRSITVPTSIMLSDTIDEITAKSNYTTELNCQANNE